MKPSKGVTLSFIPDNCKEDESGICHGIERYFEYGKDDKQLDELVERFNKPLELYQQKMFRVVYDKVADNSMPDVLIDLHLQ